MDKRCLPPVAQPFCPEHPIYLNVLGLIKGIVISAAVLIIRPSISTTLTPAFMPPVAFTLPGSHFSEMVVGPLGTWPYATRWGDAIPLGQTPVVLGRDVKRFLP